MSLDEICGHTVYTPAIRQGAIVVDLGANVGRFSTGMIQRYGAQCYAVEPNPAAHEQIVPHASLKVFSLAIAQKGGLQRFHASDNTESSSLLAHPGQHSTRALDVTVQTLGDFLREQGIEGIDVLKLDIEGAEIGVIASCSDEVLRRIVQITVEFHDFNGITPLRDVAVTIKRLRKLGFFAIRMSHSSHLDVLLINQRLCRISAARRAWLALVVRNWRGVRRMVARRFGRLTAGGR